ncbi:uncharacterized protein LOC129218271 [Uloborus diversus]|uniref:uncharacterized protein LOC129218271 n=1 Tax=Uloborus diversus TaxID=327109 RepID=UPI0024093100|nr:uncharacterized protein LOC129218271 [Uloborus diversus]
MSNPIHSSRLSCIQINLAHSRPALLQLHEFYTHSPFDLVLCQEPYITKDVIPFMIQWISFSSLNNKAVIFITNKNIHPTVIAAKQNFIALSISTEKGDIVFVSMYISPSEDPNPALFDLENFLRTYRHHKILIGGDFNGKNTVWGSNLTDSRGRLLYELFTKYSIIVLNTDNKIPTFLSYDETREGFPDLTCCSPNLLQDISNWDILPDDSQSDHRYIRTRFDFNLLTSPYNRFKTSHGHYQKFGNLIRQWLLAHPFHVVHDKASFNRFMSEFIPFIQSSMSKCFKNITIKNNNLKLHWWNSELKTQKSKIKALRRLYNRAQDLEKKDILIKIKKENANYRKNIVNAKLDAWKNFCATCRAPYGMPFRIAFRPSYKI